MKQKIRTFIVAFIFNALMFSLIHYFLDNSYSLSQLIKMGLFFGLSMGLFYTFLMPLITKKSKI
jgi:membrane protease YdiL (CAAX protease family)